jgi:glycosyltransferase involved in cell wall biosynthesis
MPVFNAEKYIARAIQSVIDQTYINWELIIIDDCSTDLSAKIISEFLLKDERIILFKLDRNSGVVIARNIGLGRARGPLISFLDADDLWFRNKIFEQVKLIKINNYAVIYSDYLTIDSGENILNYRSSPRLLNYKDLLYGNSIGMLTAMYNKRIVGDVFFENIGHEDYHFWLKILQNNNVAVGINIPLACYRVHPKSLSSSKFKSIYKTWINYRVGQNLNFHISLYYFIFYLLKAIFKRL